MSRRALYSAPTDMYRPGPIHNTGRYLAGFALHTGTATYRAQTRYIGGATFLTWRTRWWMCGRGSDQHQGRDRDRDHKIDIFDSLKS